MSLVIELPPELEVPLKVEAAKQGVDPGQYVVNTLRDRLQSSADVVPTLGADQSRLLAEINRGLSEAEWNRYHQLIDKRRAERLNDEERNELTATANRVEQLNVRRVECLAELARLRETTLPKLMEQLGIVSPPVV